MIALPLMIAVIQISETDFPDSFRRGDVGAYISCIRAEGGADADPDQMPDRTAPTIVYYGQLTRYCGPRRSRAISQLLKLIQARHPDWDKERLHKSVEFVLSGLELEVINDGRRPNDRAVHDFSTCLQF
ncbi:hypothetical protein [Sphingomonas hengshuiensis]|uniref:hypothetical protein n=1 Tax=Sphingomonas hengshuiensis TaxID=1609977 RepID=UPI0012B85CFB|nr:hypothetical protein [Sphingomonas hengshuiensis]